LAFCTRLGRLNDIEPRKTRVGSPRTNGCVERFNGTVLEEFFRPKMRSQPYETVAALRSVPADRQPDYQSLFV
jgi:transposase InsO family protein